MGRIGIRAPRPCCSKVGQSCSDGNSPIPDDPCGRDTLSGQCSQRILRPPDPPLISRIEGRGANGTRWSLSGSGIWAHSFVNFSGTTTRRVPVNRTIGRFLKDQPRLIGLRTGASSADQWLWDDAQIRARGCLFAIDGSPRPGRDRFPTEFDGIRTPGVL